MNQQYAALRAQLPYGPSFLFVDGLDEVSRQGVVGHYTFPADADYYRDHFKDHPVTPGVLLVECMAQIGLVCLGLYLLEQEGRSRQMGQLAFSEQNVLFEKPVYPGSRVEVRSQRLYWRLGKLRCQVSLYDAKGDRVCHGTLSGILR